MISTDSPVSPAVPAWSAEQVADCIRQELAQQEARRRRRVGDRFFSLMQPLLAPSLIGLVVGVGTLWLEVKTDSIQIANLQAARQQDIYMQDLGVTRRLKDNTENFFIIKSDLADLMKRVTVLESKPIRK
jgi:hypothetical protein